jgi:diacylglycerol O-acyltransferase
MSPDLTRSLSAADAAFLYLESPRLPLAIAAVSVFDGVIPFDEFVASIESKLDLVPRYRQIVVEPPLNLGLPVWQDDPYFDIRQHILRISVDPPGGEAELEALAGRILSHPLDRQKPLWEIHVIEGLKNGRGALLFRMHHALADGVSAARLQEVLLDPSPEVPPPLRKPPHRPLRPRLAQNGSLTARISGVVRNALESLISAESMALNIGENLVSGWTRESLKELAELLPELAASVERLPFNKPCGGERKFCWAELDFAEVRAVRAAAGGTVNDVVLTVLTRALVRYVKLHGESVVNRYVRIVCPVNLRKGNSGEGLGNLISFLPVALPMDVPDPLKMLQAVSYRTATMKQTGAAALVTLFGCCIAAAPAPVQALFWWALPQVIFPLPILNMICTNIPGPQMPLYAAGQKMIASYPQVPTGYELGVNCAVQSYNGKLCFGLIADAQAAPDVNRLRDFLYTSFDELSRAARKKAQAEAKKQRPQRRKRDGQGHLTRQQARKPAGTVAPPVPEIVAPAVTHAAVKAVAATIPAAEARQPRPRRKQPVGRGRRVRKQATKPAETAAPSIPEAVAPVVFDAALDVAAAPLPAAPAAEVTHAA